MFDFCTSEPELALEFVRPLQAYLLDKMSAVTALALRGIGALCRADCLDFDAAFRIISKKGKLAHLGRHGDDATVEESSTEYGDALVMAALAELCGAGAEAAATAKQQAEILAFAAEDSDEDGDGSDGECCWNMRMAVETLLAPGLRFHPEEAVRAAVYTALGAHMPALLSAVTSEEVPGDAVEMALRVCECLSDALCWEARSKARESLESTISIALKTESSDPSTWVQLKRKGGAKGGGAAAGGKAERGGPSNRLLAALPAADTVLQAFRADMSSSPGIAGATLCCYPPTLPSSSASSAGATARVRVHLDEMIGDLGHLLAAEGTGGGLGACPWQRLSVPLSVQRFVKRLLTTSFNAEYKSREGEQGSNGVEVFQAALDTCRQALADLAGVSESLITLCSASLVSCVPMSFTHLVSEDAERIAGRLRANLRENTPASISMASSGNITGARMGLLGDELLPLCAAIAMRALPISSGPKVVQAMGEMKAYAEQMTGTAGEINACDTAPSLSGALEGAVSWSIISIGVSSEWGCRNANAPEAKAIVSTAARYLLVGLGRALGSKQIINLAERVFGEGVAAPRCKPWEMMEWSELLTGLGLDSGIHGLAQPTTATGSRCLAYFMGLSSVLPGLRATGLHKELLQVRCNSHTIRSG